jgi:hypothetical protein
LQWNQEKMHKTLIVVVLTIERNIHFGQQCMQHLQFHGFNPVLKIYPSAPKDSSIFTRHQSIMQNHYKLTKWFVETFDADTHHLMVCEDDCEFVIDHAKKDIEAHITMLETNYNWSIYMVGQLAYGPLLPTNCKGLVRTTIPVTSHCYILNGQKAKHYLLSIKPSWWTTPWMVEAWFLIPCGEKFAAFPSIATQNRTIKGLNYIPWIRDIPVIRLIRVFEYGAYTLPWCIVVGILMMIRTVIR